MKVRVDERRCVGHGMCYLAAPTIFELNDEDGHARAVSPDVPADLDQAVMHAQFGCPEQAVIVTEGGEA